GALIVGAAQEAARALHVLAEGDLLRVLEPLRVAHAAVGLVHERVDLCRAGPGGAELRGVEVEEQAQHPSAVRAEVRQAAQEFVAELIGLHRVACTRPGPAATAPRPPVPRRPARRPPTRPGAPLPSARPTPGP